MDRRGLSQGSYCIWADRYALKERNKENVHLGDLCVFKPDPSSPQRALGQITWYCGDGVRVQLLDSEETFPRRWEHIDALKETDPAAMWGRVARGAASVESEDKRALWESRFGRLLYNWRFVPAGRILALAGTDQELSGTNCVVLKSPHDSRGGIFHTLEEMAECFARGSGVGINLSTLRPRDAYVKGVNGRSSGSVSWGSLYSFVTGLIEQGGSRRGALMLMLRCDHPDIEEFITVKQQRGTITNANLSVIVTDEFMQAVKENADWDLVFPDPHTGERVVWKTLPALQLWDKLITSAHRCAEPGVWFHGTATRESNSYYYEEGELVCTNPCGEQSLPAYSVCNLGHLNLAQFVAPCQAGGKVSYVNWEALAEAVCGGVRFLDNMIDAQSYFLPELEAQQKSERRIGLGTMGLAEMLIKLGIRYGSPECVTFLDRLYNFVAREAYETSHNLAIERGAFPKWNEKMLDSGFLKRLRKHPKWTVPDSALQEFGFRNVTLLTQAPTGTVGTVVGTSTGIEPFYQWKQKRVSRAGTFIEEAPVQPPSEGPVPDYYVTAMDLPPEEHVAVQAAIQKWTDSSISKTVNCPADYTVEQTAKLYELLYDSGCKGGTIYRDKSRDEQVLHRLDEEPAPTPPAPLPELVAQAIRPLPDKRPGVTVTKRTGAGHVHITMTEDEKGDPLECFLTVGKAGSDVSAMSEAIGRLISLVMRLHSPVSQKSRVWEIIHQLEGIGGPRSNGFGVKKVKSIPDAVAQALRENQGDDVEVDWPEEPLPASQERATGDLCPECGGCSLVAIEGCLNCICGFSEC